MAIHKGVATFTLDTGKCPPWLFRRMVELGRQMARAIVAEEGPDELVRRMADPMWFQSLGTVLAFDWNASGLTTVLTAAMKEAIRGDEQELGVFICGGKGKTSRKTPDEILRWSDRLGDNEKHAQSLVYNSRMAAKVDSSLIQDGYQIYHHSFMFSKNGAWTVVQQGMNKETQSARRYHWFSKNITDLINEPHAGIAGSVRHQQVLDLTARASGRNREMSAELVDQSYQSLMKDITLLRKYATPLSQVIEVERGQQRLKLANIESVEFHTHPVVREDFSKSKYLEKILWKLCDERPESYEQLLATQGVGPKTMRALSLVSEVIYGARPSYEDPARYSFALGGKDATPFPVDRATYDTTISSMKRYVEKISLNRSDKKDILHRLDVSQKKTALKAGGRESGDITGGVAGTQ